MTYSKFLKSKTSKTGYQKLTGDFPGDKVYLVEPYFVKRRTPKFSLVFKGKHLSGFYPSCLDSAFLGDTKTAGLILFQLAEGIELFEVPIKGSELMEAFCSGQLNPMLAEMRAKFSLV